MSGKKAKQPRKLDNAAAARDWSALDLLMLRDDVNWIASLGEASRSNSDWQGIVGLVLTPHMARIVYEGMDLLRRRRPAQVTAVKLEFERELEAARHTVKLLDDTQKLYEGVIQDFEPIDDEHSEAWAPGLNYALGIRDGRIFSNSRAAQFQRSGRFTAQAAIGDDYSNKFGYDIGRAVALILRQFGYAPQFTPLPIERWGIPPVPRNVDRTSYYEGRFEPEFPPALKDILCVIEGSINSCLHVFRPVQGPFGGPVFRVSYVTASHGLSSLKEVHGKYPHLAGTEGMSEVSAVLSSPEAVRILSLRKLRNRCMHYLIPPTLTGLSEQLPMYGLVEATSPGLTYEMVLADLIHVLSSLSDVLYNWRKQ
jgi:hypothetical protein